jgi:predicted dehydrogenase
VVRRVLLIGSGSIGRRHLANLRDVAPGARVTLLRRPGSAPLDPDVAAAVDRLADDMADALSTRPELAIVAGPASTHLEHALALADAGVAMLIEKPLSVSIHGCDELAARCRANAVPVVVGYTLRYHPGFIALEDALGSGTIGHPMLLRAEVGQYLPDWRPDADYRTSVSAIRALGGGPLLELSHELDLARALFGMPASVTAHLARLSDLTIDTEDTVELVLRHPGATGGRPTVSSIHLDVLQRPIRRVLRIGGTDGSLELDFVTGTLVRVAIDGRATQVPFPALIDRNELYRVELADLLAAMDGRRPRVGLDDGIATMRIIDAARRSDAAGTAISLEAAA